MITAMAMKKYTDDYEAVVSVDEAGHEKTTTVYRGPYLELLAAKDSIEQFKRKCIALLAAVVVLHTGAGFINNAGMYRFYVALPYVLAFFPLVFLAFGILRLPKEKQTYRRDEIGHSYERMKTASRWLITLLGIGLLGEIVFIFFPSASHQVWRECLYLVTEALAAASVYSLIRMQKQIRVQICNEQ
jgi:hypothetical protein